MMYLHYLFLSLLVFFGATFGILVAVLLASCISGIYDDHKPWI